MVAATFEQVANWRPSLIRRPNKGFVLIGNMSATLPAAYTSGVSAEFQDLGSAGFKSLGLTAKDAPPTFRPEIESSDVEAWGALEPPRTDIISRKMTVSTTLLETKRQTLELYSGLDLSAIDADATTGELQWNDPTAPETRYHRLIFGMVDGSGTDQIWILRVFPRATVTEIGEQSWSQDGSLSYNITWSAKIDETLGYAMKNVICGPGVTTLLDEMDFTATASVPTITSHLPAGSLAAAGGESVVLLGQHFTGTTGVTVGGTAATDFTIIDDTHLAIISPAKTAGSHNVVVTNATGASANYAVTYA
ncbi:IPT/TIG domain-containing protein [Nocardia higoensis]|uniref:IPT/TIG domain-containing protein n=1 Tax=Nocardia higoensis TaxID=228599 RepID=A0ABS0DIC4_9NOCA|nr:IPT/TIG domain-containing protein [Nocardia higoensis]MBF6358201.1 IPT/TIG domain-containing protein [Nocardia higoensis]